MRSSTSKAIASVPALAAAIAAASILAARPAAAQGGDTTATASRAMLAERHRQVAHGDSAAARAAGASPRMTNGRPDAAVRRHAPRNAGMYTLMLGAGVLYNLTCPLGTLCDRDAGGYDDNMRGMDKVAHASTAATLTSFAISGGVQPEAAALLTFAAGIGFELTQTQGGGYYSARDVAANGTGVLLAWGWHRLTRWKRGA